MVLLKNIKKINQIISCEYYPEGKCEKGVLKIDTNNNEVIELERSLEDEDIDMYIRHAKLKLIELAGKKKIPEEYCCAWY